MIPPISEPLIGAAPTSVEALADYGYRARRWLETHGSPGVTWPVEAVRALVA